MSTKYLVAILLITNVSILSAQKDARVTPTSSTPPASLAPRGLFAAQTEPRAITLSWYGALLPSGTAAEQYVKCTVDGREMRPSQVSTRKRGPGVQTEAALHTFVVPVTSEVAHRCVLEVRTRSGAKAEETVTRYAFNEVTPRLTPGPLPPSPTQVVAQIIAPGSIRLTWSGSEGATAVHIQRRAGREGLRTICFMCPPIGVYMDSISSARPDFSVQYAVTALSPGGRSRPAMSPELRLNEGRGGVVATETPTSLPPGIVVASIAGGTAPTAGAVARSTVQENEKSVTQIVRLGPLGQVPQHHHPNHSETVVVHAGEVEVMIGTQRQFLRAGDVAYIPAGTTMSVLNISRINEAQIVAVFSSIGTAGPLMVPGPSGN